MALRDVSQFASEGAYIAYLKRTRDDMRARYKADMADIRRALDAARKRRTREDPGEPIPPRQVDLEDYLAGSEPDPSMLEAIKGLI